MKKTQDRLFAVGLTAFIVLAGSVVPALSQCVIKHPLLGINVYVDDKDCPNNDAATNAETPNEAVKLSKPDPQVKEIQTLLTQLGFKPGPADGINGPVTNKALQKFYATRNLPNSTSRSKGLAVLKRTASATPKSVKLASTGTPDVRKMQMRLATLGYEPGPSDGINRPATTRAMGYFRQNYGVSTSASHNDQMASLNRISTRYTSKDTKTSPAGNPEVKKMQIQLATLGYEPGSSDGVNRPATTRAMGYFRQNYGVSASTSHNDQMAALDRISTRYNSKDTNTSPVGNPEVKKMQIQLATLGYEPGSSDGVNRPATTRAMGYFRQNYGVSEQASHEDQMAALKRISSR